MFSEVRLDSAEGELTFARLIERDDEVLNWLRPAPAEFNITYNGGKKYQPDFVVEISDHFYLVEVKADNELGDLDVIAKKQRGVLYCKAVTRWSEVNGRKPWSYLLIPAKQIYPQSTFMMLAKKFIVEE